MALLFTSASTEYLKSAAAVLTATPVSMVARIFLNTQQFQFFTVIRSEGTSDNGFLLYMTGSGGGFELVAETGGGGGAQSSRLAGVPITAGAWHDVIFVSASPTSRFAYLDGVGAAEGTESRTPSGIDVMGVGVNPVTVPNFSIDGAMADVGFYKAALTPADVALYHLGVPASEIRPDALVAGPPLLDDASGPIDRIPTNIWVVGGSPTNFDHPPTILPLATRSLPVLIGDDGIAAATIVAVGAASEVDTALAVASSKVLSAGLVAEVDSAFAVAGLKALAVGLPAEVDSAFGITFTKVLAAGTAAEVDAAFAITFTKALAAGLAAEVDTALGASTSKALAAGLAAEVDTALAIALIKKALAVGLASEVDAALVVNFGTVVAAGLANESDAAQVIALIKKTFPVGVAPETDSALAMTSAKVLAVAFAPETDAALSATALKSLAVGLAAEVDSAFAITHSRSATVGLAAEIDSALALVFVDVIIGARDVVRLLLVMNNAALSKMVFNDAVKVSGELTGASSTKVE